MNQSTSVTLNTGAKIPAIGFGTWQIKPWETEEAVSSALKLGYRHIDTARIYLNEKQVGSGIRKSNLSRQEIFVTTKLWNLSHGKKRAPRAFEASLKKLGLEYIDLYLVHWPVKNKRVETWNALEFIQQTGRAKAIGVSNFNISHLEELRKASGTVPAVNQVEFHPFLYEDQRPLLEYCQEQGIVLEAYSPLAHGKRMNEIPIATAAKAHGKSTAQVMIRWAIQHGAIPLPKSSKLERIKQNLDVFDFELSKKEMDTINGLSDGMRTCWNPTDKD